MTRNSTTFLTALAAVGVLGLTAVAGCDDGDGDESGADGLNAELSVVVNHPDQPTIEYQLTCDGGEASIGGDEVDVDASAACQTLTDQAALDRLTLGAPTGRICAEVFGGPDVATISGVVDEVTVATMVDRTDACMIEDWDSLLGDLLPPPRDPSG